MVKSSKYWRMTFTKKGKVRKLSKKKYGKVRKEFEKKFNIDIGSYSQYKKRL